jgi:RHS repeat-associated protein
VRLLPFFRRASFGPGLTFPLLSLIGATLLTPAINVRAQDSTTFQEQFKLIKAPKAYASLGPDLFGDKVNLYSGGLEFAQTDVSLPGNNALPVAIGRRLVAGRYTFDKYPFGHWQLDIPHLHGIFALGNANKRQGWTDSSGGLARCSSFGAPAEAKGLQDASTWAALEFWQGNHMYVPGAGDQQLLRRVAANTAAPADIDVNGLKISSFPVVTSGKWSLGCVPTLANGSGEGFAAVGPDGTRYVFNWMVAYPAKTLSKKSPAPMALKTGSLPQELSNAKIASDTSEQAVTPRASVAPRLPLTEVWILPTKVIDRFGNTVTYSFDPQRPANLKRIESSDGRVITITYVTDASGDTNRIQTVSDQTRTWTYGYHGITGSVSLDQVTLPDNSTWQLGEVDNLLTDPQYPNDPPACLERIAPIASSLTATLQHPSGASGTFTLKPTEHGRSDVQQWCMDKSLLTPIFYFTNSLTDKTISGPGLSPMTWRYDYGPGNGSFAPCNDCVTSTTVSVTDPKGDVSRYTFGNRYFATEGKVLQIDIGWNGHTALRTTSNRYRAANAGPYLVQDGTSEEILGDGESDLRNTPLDQRVITQQAETFTWEATEFDSFARPTLVVKGSSVSGKRTEKTEYADNVAKWVIGPVRQVTDVDTGKVMVSNGYNASTASLERVTRFGKLEWIMAYNLDGTLASSKDEKNPATKYEDYKLGIPRLVSYPNGTTERFVVDGIGGITDYTNGAGYTTTFGRDAMGRINSVSYPSSDKVAWNRTSINFSAVTSQEFDLDPGHWRQVVTTGDAVEVNYLDALWRPVYTERWDDKDRANTIRLVKYGYDFAGRTTFESYPKRDPVGISDGLYHEFDALGRPTVTSTISELGTLYSGFSYKDGFLRTYNDARGHDTNHQFQAYDEPAEDAIVHISAPENVEVDISRDTFGKPLALTRSGNGNSATRRYAYDANERLCKTFDPEIGATVQAYDLASNVSWRAIGLDLLANGNCDIDKAPESRKIRYDYDSLNRLQTTSYADGSASVGRTYTADGLPETVTSGGALWTYAYNKRRLNISEILSYGGATYTIGRDYDANGSLVKLTYPDNTAVSYNPNALGEARQVGSYASSLVHHPSGAIKSFSYGNGIAHSMSQNLRGLPELTADAGVLKDRYTYDANANVAAIADLQGSTGDRTMDYDDLDRLVHVLAPSSWGDAWYTYDSLDNLTSTKLTGGATTRNTIHTFDPVTNTLKGIFNRASNGASFSYDYDYDAQGNIKWRGSQSYTFDQGNRMTSAVGKATYRYDGLGRRVSVVGTDGVNRVQVYSQDGQLLYVKASNSATPTKYVYLHKHVLAEVNGAQVTYDHTDGLGSPVAQTNASGVLLSRTRYEPYGAAASGKAGAIGFSGHANDSETSLVYMQQRYYDPAAGRFLSIDPAVTDAATGVGFNRYAYANNSPYNYVDPDGRNPWLLRASFEASYFVATRAGAGILGSMIGTAIYDAIHSDSSDAPKPGDGNKTTPAVGQGCIYCVPGNKTSSGKDYIGSTDDLDRRSKDSSDGRDRKGAGVIDTYPIGDREDRRRKEQQAINDKGGLSETDNKRNEIRDTKWGEKGVEPPPPKRPEAQPAESARN